MSEDQKQKAQKSTATRISLQPIMVKVEDAAAICANVHKSTFYKGVAQGIAPRARMFMGSSVYLVSELQQMAENLPFSNRKPPPRGGE